MIRKAVVLAAGHGTCLRPFTRTIEVEPESKFVTCWKSPDLGVDGTFTYCGFAILKPGRYALCVSVGTRQGTPKIALPLAGRIGTTRRYEIGRITVE